MNSPRIRRVLQVLNLVALNPEPTRLGTLGEALGLHPSTVSRIVADLVAGGLLVKCAYRSVIAAPELALLGERAGENHPLSRISREILPPFLAEMGLSGDVAAAAPDGLYHFFLERRGTPPPEPIWRSDLAAVIFGSFGMSWEEASSRLEPLIPAGAAGELARFRSRMEEAAGNRYLVNFHSGRFWQLTLPLQCGPFRCAFSVARPERPPDDQVFLECSRIAGKMRSAYGAWKSSSC